MRLKQRSSSTDAVSVVPVSARTYWRITLAGAALLMVTMGARQSMGMFISPMNTATALGIASISLSLAIGQLVWGAVQPVAGAFADRYGHGRVLVIGAVVLALGYVITPLMTSHVGLAFSIGVLMAAGSGLGSFSVLIGATAHHLPAERRGMAAGVINAGASFGQMVFAPIVQKLITLSGWVNAMWIMALVALATLPLARILRRPVERDDAPAASGYPAVAPKIGLRAAIKQAVCNPSFLLLNLGFFTCGFHIAFLVTHLPGEIDLCGMSPSVASWSLSIIGLANILGSLAVGWGVGRFRSKTILFWMYTSRAVLIGLYLVCPKTETTFYVFALGLGATWLATVPPTAGLVGKLFGTTYLSTLFGLTLFSHQVGGFLGAWLGGIAVVELGNYQAMWYADIALAVVAALANLPIREAKMQPRIALTA
ncbi:MAG TPA: MFS transporter [Betaproteobacteria bacterium]|jgi:MFS family permease|nr:MFS transporter [Betaproteobacteria bacterium]